MECHSLPKGQQFKNVTFRIFTFAVIRKRCKVSYSFRITEPFWVQIQTKILVPQKDVQQQPYCDHFKRGNPLA
jgi:hypothetical protein